MSPASPPEITDARLGWITATTAFTIWGLVPIFFRTIEAAGAGQIIAHRILWTGVLLLGGLAIAGQLSRLTAIRGRWLLFVTSTALVTANWSTYIWAALNDFMVQASLGYFMTPLVNVVLGIVFLREKLRPAQIVAVGLAAAGVVVSIVAAGVVPWVSLILANTWAFYGLLHKKYRMDPIGGLAIETVLLLPFCLGFVLWLGATGTGSFGPAAIGGEGWWMSLMLMAAGAVTAVPLILFMTGAKHLPLASLGLVQYVTPSLQFLVAVWIYGEPFADATVLTFTFIWTGLAIFTWDALRRPSAAARA